jgi:alpha-ketoglutarate-dependent taurine dioxygenase
MSIEVIPSKAALGAEIRGVDISRLLSPAQCDAIRKAWHQHLVLRFRGKVLTDAQLLAFARNFGELQHAPSNEVSAKFGGDHVDYPEIAVVSNILEAGKPIGALGSGEAFWHTDSSFIEQPPAGSFLHALEIPPSGGDTSFCNLYLAWQTLAANLKERIRGRKALHNFSYVASGTLRKGFEETTDVTKAPGAHHPMVRTHPETGRQALFLGRRLKSYIIGLPVAQSEALLDELWAHATQPKFVWTQQWQLGDLILWDNRCTMHRRDAFDPGTRRLMHRAQTKGDIPVGAEVFA